MAQPKSSSKSSKSKPSTTSKKVVAPATGKKVSRVVVAKSAKTVELTSEAVITKDLVTEAVIAAAPAVVLPAPVLKPTREVTRAEFMDLVRKEAYRRAATRNFRNGSPFQDWVNAEATVSGKLAAEGARLS